VPILDLARRDSLPLETELLWGILEDTSRMRRGEVGPIADKWLSWSPGEGMHSIGAVMMHVIEAESEWIHEIAGRQVRTPAEREFQQADRTDQWGLRWADAPGLSWDELLAEHDRVRQRSRQIVETLADPDATAPLGDRTVTLRWILKHIVTHEAYHFGQIELLKQMASRAIGPA
jgi:uncharacterized damage-inducible protein DinB